MDNNLTVRIAQPPGVNVSLSGPETLYAKSLNYLDFDFVFSTGVETPNGIVKRDVNGYANFTTARTVAGAAAIYATATGGSDTFAIDARGTNGSGAVSGIALSGTSIQGQSTSGIGVYGTSNTGVGGVFETGSGVAGRFFSFGGNFAEFVDSADQGVVATIGYDGNISTNGYVQAASVTANNLIYNGGNTNSSDLVIGTNDNYNLNLETGGSNRLTILSNGNVGIGTTAPTQLINSYSASNANTGIRAQVGTNWIDLKGNNGSGHGGIATSSGILDLSNVTVGGHGGTGTSLRVKQNGTTGSSQTIQSWVNASNTTAMIVNSASNVGIGTGTPNEKLTVVGNISATGNIAASGTVTGTTGTFSGGVTTPSISQTTGASQIWTTGPVFTDAYTWAVQLNGVTKLALNNAGNLNSTSFSIFGQPFASGSFGALTLAANTMTTGTLTASGTVTVGGTNTWTGSTFSGAQAFTGAVSVTDATASTTTTTGALKVAGGLGVAGAINAGAITGTTGTFSGAVTAPSVTSSAALTLASAANGNVNLTPNGTGFIDLAKTSAASTRETLFRAKVSDSGDDVFLIYNATSVNARFVPGFAGAVFSNSAASSLVFKAMTITGNDAGITPMMQFEATTTSSQTDPANGTQASIGTRPLYRWLNSGVDVGTVAANGQWTHPANIASTSTTTGTLVVTGGIGASGNVNIGANLTASGSITASGVSNTLPNQTAVTPDSILTRQLADDRYLVNDNASSIIGLALFL